MLSALRALIAKASQIKETALPNERSKVIDLPTSRIHYESLLFSGRIVFLSSNRERERDFSLFREVSSEQLLVNSNSFDEVTAV